MSRCKCKVPEFFSFFAPFFLFSYLGVCVCCVITYFSHSLHVGFGRQTYNKCKMYLTFKRHWWQLCTTVCNHKFSHLAHFHTHTWREREIEYMFVFLWGFRDEHHLCWLNSNRYCWNIRGCQWILVQSEKIEKMR